MTSRIKNKLGWTYDIVLGVIGLVSGVAVTYGALNNQVQTNKETIKCSIEEIKADEEKKWDSQMKVNEALLNSINRVDNTLTRVNTTVELFYELGVKVKE